MVHGAFFLLKDGAQMCDFLHVTSILKHFSSHGKHNFVSNDDTVSHQNFLKLDETISVRVLDIVCNPSFYLFLLFHRVFLPYKLSVFLIFCSITLRGFVSVLKLSNQFFTVEFFSINSVLFLFNYQIM